MRQVRIRRKCLLLCLLGIGLVTVLYEGLAFSVLDNLNTVQYVDCKTSEDKAVRLSASDQINDPATMFERVEAVKVFREFAGFHNRDIAALANKPVVNTVHFVWCGNKTFEFVHYLSVISAWKVLQPDIIEFHAEFPPLVDKYNTWFDEVLRTIPSFVVKSLPKTWDGEEKGCGFWFGLAVIDDRGGIYIDHHVILGPDAFSYREKETASVFLSKQDSGDYSVSMAIAKEHAPEFRKFRINFDQSSVKNKDIYTCQRLNIGTTMNKSSVCYVLSMPFNPKDIFKLTTNLGTYTRKLVYGSEKVMEEKSFLPGKIPKIVHYVWFGSKEVNFVMYLSILSTLFILNPEKVIIYTDGFMTGAYLDRIKRDKRVVFVRREKPDFVFGKRVLYGQHRSDVVRAEVLLQYGGIYMDWDVLWLRNADDLINKGYDVIANYDHMPRAPFPETVNLGVLMSKPKAVFIKRWQDALINYRSKDFLYNAVELPYKIYEKFPEHIHIEPRLQVMCFHFKCHPTFHQDYKQFSDDQPFDWRTDVYSIHFTSPDPPEYASEEALKNGTGRFADIGRYILQHSSKLD